jgi:hypothetical protein
LKRAKKAVENIKRLRLDEGPEEPTVYSISGKVNRIVTEREAQAGGSRGVNDMTYVANRGPVNEKIRAAIKEETAVRNEQYLLIGSIEPIFKAQPGIKPIGGVSPVQVEQEAFLKSRKNIASLSDLVTSSHKERGTRKSLEAPTFKGF